MAFTRIQFGRDNAGGSRPCWRLAALIALCASVIGAFAHESRAQLIRDQHPAEELGVGMADRRGEQVPLDIAFLNAQGEDVLLSEYFDGTRPVVLILGYYDCPLLCTKVFDSAQNVFNELKFTLGDDYRAIAVSFDHTNTTEEAALQQEMMLGGYERDVKQDADSAWSFLTGSAANARALADSVGFGYVYMPKADEYSHPASLMVLTPDGEVSNYLYGMSYDAKELRLSLLDAADGKIGSLIDRFYGFCHIVGADGQHTLAAMRIVRIAGLGTVVILGSIIGGLLWRSSRTGNKGAGAMSASIGVHDAGGRTPAWES